MTDRASGEQRAGPPLEADCSRCAGLCCVAPAFARSADFPVAKKQGVPCRNLEPDFRCGIHPRLREEGWVGCTVFDCQGAGQQVTQRTFGGRDWRSEPEIAGPMFAAFATMRQIHGLLAYVTEALALGGAAERELGGLRDRLVACAELDPSGLQAVDVGALRSEAHGLLLAVSAARRGGGPDHSRVDWLGARRRGADLRRGLFLGALCIGADLREADLRDADLRGADLRAADLRGADLRGAFFLTRSQLASAVGDRTTRIEAERRPAHWG